jgi:RimJ/RimL family protein N-acetyltransferase
MRSGALTDNCHSLKSTRAFHDMTFSTIETARLRLRPFRLDDVDVLHRLWTEPEVRQYLWDGDVIKRERVESMVKTSLKSFADHGFGLWAVLPRDENILIGFCGY